MGIETSLGYIVIINIKLNSSTIVIATHVFIIIIRYSVSKTGKLSCHQIAEL